MTEIRTQIENSGKPYLLLQPSSDTHAHFLFLGNFIGKEVVWDTRLMTLKHYCREHNSNNGPESPNQQRQFIEISTEQKQSVPLTIGLDLPTINEPTILKTIIMIRNYKRLILGRHEFGPMLYCKSDRA